MNLCINPEYSLLSYFLTIHQFSKRKSINAEGQVKKTRIKSHLQIFKETKTFDFIKQT